MAMAKRAETAQELKEKYGNKRFSSSTAWKIVLYNYIYAAYQIEEGAKTGEIKQLYSGNLTRRRTRTIQDIIARIDRNEDLLRYNAFVHLQEWTQNAFVTAVFVRNGLALTISNYHNIAASIISAEELSEVLGSKAEESEASLWLSNLTIDRYGDQAEKDEILALRRNITLALRHIKAYNTFIEIIASAVKIPEFTVFKVDTKLTNESLIKLNDALSALVSLIQERKGTENEYINNTLTAFRPVETEAEPIPDQNIKKSNAIISVICQQGYKTWTSAFSALYAGYWRQA